MTDELKPYAEPGTIIRFAATSANTGRPSINAGYRPVDLVKSDGTRLMAGDLTAGQECFVALPAGRYGSAKVRTYRPARFRRKPEAR